MACTLRWTVRRLTPRNARDGFVGEAGCQQAQYLLLFTAQPRRGCHCGRLAGGVRIPRWFRTFVEQGGKPWAVDSNPQYPARVAGTLKISDSSPSRMTKRAGTIEETRALDPGKGGPRAHRNARLSFEGRRIVDNPVVDPAFQRVTPSRLHSRRIWCVDSAVESFDGPACPVLDVRVGGGKTLPDGDELDLRMGERLRRHRTVGGCPQRRKPSHRTAGIVLAAQVRSSEILHFVERGAARHTCMRAPRSRRPPARADGPQTP